MKSKTPELCVIGGGAAGLAAAVEAARAFRQAGIPGGVTVLEQLPRVGKKLLGNGQRPLQLDQPARFSSRLF